MLIVNLYHTIDGRWCDYMVEDIVYDVRSEHQHVVIMKTMDFGMLLFLDGYANLAESDTVQYTHSLMHLPEVIVLEYLNSNFSSYLKH